jgi:DNA-binding CsgD family transcriptional regulator/tetratricopeptide (TPR) repeat protein
MSAREQLAAGSAAMAKGDWATARDEFRSAWSETESADALDGVGRALWWLGDPAGSLELRARAFALFRREHREPEAAAVAIWLARQHRNLYLRTELADGWLARAKSLLPELPDRGTSLSGWLVLAESEIGPPRPEAADAAGLAVMIGRERADRDLEIVALSRRGACRVSGGMVSPGLDDLNEAMAAATSGEGSDVQYVGEALCTLFEVAGLVGDAGMVDPWAGFLVGYRSSYAFGPLLPFETATVTELISAFCTGCCGGVYLVTGRLDAAEAQLEHAATELITTGLRPRCLHPIADLVELRVLQGRLQEAEAILSGFDDDVDCATAAAALDLALGRPASAVNRLQTALDRLQETPMPTLPLLARLVDAAVGVDDVALAETACRRIEGLASLTGTRLHAAFRDHALGKIALVTGGSEATRLLRSACLGFARSGAPLQAARARIGMARSLVDGDRGLAVAEARSALNAFDRMGATAEADQAAAFLRELGAKGRTGPRDAGLLSRRELEVLRLVAEGLSNAEIATRLFISTKTAGNHVSNILTKLGLRSRTEAAAFALLNVPQSPSTAPADHP